MSDFLPIIAAVVSTVGALWAGYQATKRLSKFGLSTEQLQVSKTLRELAEVERAKRALLEEDIATLRQRLRDTQHALDDCSRQRDDVYAELRGVRFRKKPRAET